ncbi:hypothetical protein [Hymenobacter glacialis]|uniref:Uncharacterized protein n=1 Tax=Hymenobacter glacialis TaxID=1908236 RepID=A0A1G1TBG0_9BACT|nr:hypothetical protein [Hymenobacter glacialis]OGX88207.1 hypothetical protein BEN48_10315 [Hymenobacter glacialis]
MDTPNTPNSPDNDSRPQDQQDRAASAHPNPNDPAVNAHKPAYGEFGGEKPANGTARPDGRDGSNDNPDEFSEFRSEKDAQDAPANPADQTGHVEQNQAPDAVRATQDESNEEQRAAWAKDDPRWAGGGTHNTRNESDSTDTHK